MLARVWELLDEAQHQGGQPYYSVLRFRAQQPDASSTEMAAYLSGELRAEHPLTDAAARKLLQRARMRFADLLIDEVAATLQNPSLEDLEQELIHLDLLHYCRSALQRRRGGK
jgi:hypothetical protein